MLTNPRFIGGASQPPPRFLPWVPNKRFKWNSSKTGPPGSRALLPSSPAQYLETIGPWSQSRLRSLSHPLAPAPTSSSSANPVGTAEKGPNPATSHDSTSSAGPKVQAAVICHLNVGSHLPTGLFHSILASYSLCPVQWPRQAMSLCCPEGQPGSHAYQTVPSAPSDL